jgi:hypothetical protein
MSKAATSGQTRHARTQQTCLDFMRLIEHKARPANAVQHRRGQVSVFDLFIGRIARDFVSFCSLFRWRAFGLRCRCGFRTVGYVRLRLGLALWRFAALGCKAAAVDMSTH